jgi:hypothetical protein
VLEIFNDAKRVQVVIEGEPVLAHGGVEGFFSGVAEWGMADVMHQGQGFDEVNVQSQLCGDGARDLRDLERMRKPIAEMIGIAAGEDLGLGLQPTKRARMDYPVAVALKVVAVGVLRLRMTASAGILHGYGVGGKIGTQHSALGIQQSRCDSMVAKCGDSNRVRRVILLNAEC